MKSVYGWMLARVGIVLVLILGMRFMLKTAIEATVGGAASAVSAVTDGAANGTLDMDAIMYGEGGGIGDAGRAGQPIHEDLAEAGQVVMRDGKLGVLVPSDDPTIGEQWIPLNAEAPQELPWIATNEVGQWFGATMGAAGVYLFGWGSLAVVRAHREDQDEDIDEPGKTGSANRL